MNDEIDIKDTLQHIMRRLGNLESHIINLIVPVNNICSVLSFPNNLKELMNLLSRPIQIDDTRFRSHLADLNRILGVLHNDTKNLDISQTFGEIKFIGKRLNDIEQSICKIQKDGIDQKINVDFSCNGYELVKKKKIEGTSIEIVGDETVLIDLLQTLTDRERTILIHRFGLFGQRKETYQGIGVLLKKNAQTVNTNYHKAIRKLRHPSRKKYVDKINHKELLKAIRGDKE